MTFPPYQAKKNKDFIVLGRNFDKADHSAVCYPSELYCESRKGKLNLQKVGTHKKVNPIPCLLRRTTFAQSPVLFCTKVILLKSCSGLFFMNQNLRLGLVSLGRLGSLELMNSCAFL